jgi:putative ABC transport system ATP-binding protein
MLELKQVSKTFNPGTVNEKTALEGVDLRLEPGDFVTIVGSNGAGKSTLFNAVAGDFLIDAGSITLDGADITYQPAYRRSRRIGRLFQDPMRGTAPHMTIEENLALAYPPPPSTRALFSAGCSKADTALFREQLARLGMGLEYRTPALGLLPRQRQALTLLMATRVPAQAAGLWTAHAPDP